VNEHRNIRLDICWPADGNGDAKLAGVLVLDGNGDVPKSYDTTAADVAGLGEALFGDVGTLKMIIPFETGAFPAQSAALEIRGYNTAVGKVVTAGRFYSPSGNPAGARALYPFHTVLTGSLGPGDPFPSGERAFGETLRVAHTKAEAQNFDWP
jgi:hypothetical protein